VRSAAEDGAPVSIPDLVRGSGGSDDEARLLAGLP
jgi:hypothetical protein